ncbi:MAG: hypothetical protein KGJ70_09285, partial [Gemmatimonadota bacterium]|nr:hypothetical protein [Gemmatimonadota bacterium]
TRGMSRTVSDVAVTATSGNGMGMARSGMWGVVAATGRHSVSYRAGPWSRQRLPACPETRSSHGS